MKEIKLCLKKNARSDLESYKHNSAKIVLMNWLKKKYTVRIEQSFGDFRPDLAVYDNKLLVAFYEVTHKNGITGEKIHRIQKWSYLNNIPVRLFEVDAEWIMNKCTMPEKIRATEYIVT